MQPVASDFDNEASNPVDRLLIALRAYVTRAPRKSKKGEKEAKSDAGLHDPRDFTQRLPPSDWVLVFDCNPHHPQPTLAVRRLPAALQGPAMGTRRFL
jgi:hypothetical protein